MRKYRNLYQYNGKWYTKEQRVAKVGELVLIVNKSPYSNNDFKNGDILKIINATGQWTDGTRYGNKIGQFLEQSEYRVLVPRINGMEITDTWYDEMTQMEQPVPFSKEYYNAPNKMTQEEYVKSIDTLQRALRKINTLVDICRSEIEKLPAWLGDKK